MDDPDLWRWLWLGTAAVFAVGEMASAGTFFLAPFAVGAVVAAVIAFLGVNLAIQWLAFVGVSVAVLAALRPLAHRFSRHGAVEGIGSKRLIGEHATVLAEIPEGVSELGLIRVHREEWRAESVDGTAVPAGAKVRIVELRGTRVVVVPESITSSPEPPAVDPAGASDDPSAEDRP